MLSASPPIAPFATVTNRARMTAYTVVVGPSSDSSNRVTDFAMAMCRPSSVKRFRLAPAPRTACAFAWHTGRPVHTTCHILGSDPRAGESDTILS